MDTREILEQAAKAAGINGKWTDHYYGGEHNPKNGMNGLIEFGNLWNPLVNDGDALRLSVLLQLTVGNEHHSANSAYCLRSDDENWVGPTVCPPKSEEHAIDEDDFLATRKAIVLAAAQIYQESV